MDDYVRKALLWRLQLIDEEIKNMAEDIVALREQLPEMEKQLVLMSKERAAISDHLMDKE